MLDKFSWMQGDIFKAIFDLVDEHPPLTVVTVNGCLIDDPTPTHINAQVIVSDATGTNIYQTKYGRWPLYCPGSEGTGMILEGFADPVVNVHLQILPRTVLVIDNFMNKYHIEVSSADLTAKDFAKFFCSPSGTVDHPKKLYTRAGIRFTAHVQAISPTQTLPVKPVPSQQQVPVATVQVEPAKQESHAEHDTDLEVIKNDNHKTNLESVLGDVLEQSKEIVNHIHKEKEKDPNAFVPPKEPQPELPHSLDDLKALTKQQLLDRISDDAEPEDPVFNQDEDEAVEFEDVAEEPKTNEVK